MRLIFAALFILLSIPAWADGVDASKLIAAARSQIGVTMSYDPAYRKIPYPGGDVAQTTGVCSDVVIRAYRQLGIDLQKQVHEDMAKHFSLYPKQWGLKSPDTNIDHRRVPNLQVFFTRHGTKLAASSNAQDYAPGDIVTWDLHSSGSPLPHIGIVSDRKNSEGTPLVIHNIGGGAQEEDSLFTYRITGHYRFALK